MEKIKNEYFTRNEKNELVLISYGVEYKIRLTERGKIKQFYQYPSDEEMAMGGKPKKRLISEISDSLPE
jgi:hypothetical protein